MKKLELWVSLFAFLCVGTFAMAANDMNCLDTDTFTPLQFSLEDDEVKGPIFKFQGLYSGQAIAKLGLLSVGQHAFEAQDLSISLPSQPRKSIHPTDHLIRQYTHFELTGSAIAKYSYDGATFEKEVQFMGFESAKRITASGGTSYSLFLRLQHSGKNWAYDKHYYSHSCR